MDLVQIKYGASLNGIYLEAACDMEPGDTAMTSWGELERLVQRELARYGGGVDEMKKSSNQSPNKMNLKTVNGYLEVNCVSGRLQVIQELFALSVMARELGEQLSKSA